MILAIEIDNSRINFGIFENDGTLAANFGIATNVAKTSDEYAVLIDSVFNYYKVDRNSIEGVAICSVVPMLTSVIYALINQIFPHIEIINVEKGIKTGFSIKVDNPSELGADLVANAAGAMELLKDNKDKKPCVIIDMGTASTIFAINQNNEFVGGSIIPGIEMSFNALHGKTAQLPNVSPTTPTKAIGKNSQESMRSGVILGTALMIDGFIEKFAKEMKAEEINVIITGEFSQAVIPFCSCKHSYVPNLTLFGLYCIYRKNINR